MLCLVVGGGHVASRKVAALLPCGAVVRIVSPQLCHPLDELFRAGMLEWQQKEYHTGDIVDARLVFAATDKPAIQKQIVKEANEAGVLVNVIDMPDACTFQVPASFRQGDLLLTVATGGGSPALAARIKKEFKALYGAEYGQLVSLMSGIRGDVVASSESHVARKRIFEKLLESDILKSIKEKQWDKLESLLQQILPTGMDVSPLVKSMQNYKE